jgi:hypothetical protein
MRIEEWVSALELAKRDYNSDGDPTEILSKLATEPFHIDSWDSFHDWERRFPHHGCFRGQKNFKWGLQSTLDRIVTSPRANRSEYRNSTQVSIYERDLVQEFQMAAHLYTDITSLSFGEDDCLATMQHHGCPTRLLDWTYSPHVALYFAIFEKWEEDSAIWALDMNWVYRTQHALGNLYSKLRDLNPNVFPQMYCIRPANLSRLNQRIVSQRGVLLYTSPTYAFSKYQSQPFGECLLEMLLTEESNAGQAQVVSKIHVKQSARSRLLEELNRVNVN